MKDGMVGEAGCRRPVFGSDFPLNVEIGATVASANSGILPPIFSIPTELAAAAAGAVIRQAALGTGKSVPFYGRRSSLVAEGRRARHRLAVFAMPCGQGTLFCVHSADH